jgi:UDP-GlcNAc:undecaprenyl-phosphate/decaprenyl-phosphate GlcNAc-1-phosphate transferase
MDTHLAGFALAVIVSMTLTRTVRYAATRLGWLDAPNAARKRHAVPTPRIGGLAIYFAILVTLGVLAVVPSAESGAATRTMSAILSLSGLMLLVGLWDDLKGITPPVKLAAQTAIAVLAWTLGFRILAGWSYDGVGLNLGVLSLPITVVWIVGITNAFNLIDGLDGLAAGTALFAMIALSITSMVTGPSDVVVLLTVLGGATAGFLRYNFSPASIFLGDSGALLLGFLLSVLSIHASQKSAAAFAIAVPLVSLGLPMLDTAIVVIRRFLSGQPIFRADRRHIHHALLERGLSPRSAVILLYGVAGLLGLISLLFLNPVGRTVGLVLVMLGVGLVVAIQQLRIPELQALNAYMSRHLRHQRDLLASSIAMKQATDRFGSASSSRELFAMLQAALEQSTFSRAEVRWRADAASPRLANVRPSNEGGGTWRWTRRNSPETDQHWHMSFPLHGGTLTLYHELGAAYPVSAIGWLGQGMTLEFQRALRRVQARPAARPRLILRRSTPTVAPRNPGKWPATETHA